MNKIPRRTAARPDRNGHPAAAAPDTVTWIAFQAQTKTANKDEVPHDSYFGVFVCPPLRPEPQNLLAELLSNQNLSLAEIRDTRSVPKNKYWGMNEGLKAQVEEQGYGLSLTKMHFLEGPELAE